MVVGRFNHQEIEKNWQGKWEESHLYSPKEMGEVKNKFYNLWMFPYPTAEGVHVGTIFAATGSDIYGRYQRMHDKTVFQPFGYDSFGIHSENFALKVGETPQKMLSRVIPNYQSQFKMVGHQYDWNRTVTTSDADYYRWTQWLFIEFFKAGLAYRAKHPVNWCPGCKTVLADEQIQTPTQAGKVPPGYEKVEDVPEGVKVCERCGNIPEIKDLEQWFFRITDYAERLLADQKKIDWSERVSVAQRNWIGKSEGVEITWEVTDKDGNSQSGSLVTYTTRKDTIPGVTFIVVAPGSAYARSIATKEQSKDVKEYISTSKDVKEDQKSKEKSGVFTGAYAKNPFNNSIVPVYIADYILEGYGTGAVMGMPGHDERDREFAKIFDLPTIFTTKLPEGFDPEKVYTGIGEQMNTGEGLDGLSNKEAAERIFGILKEKGLANEKTQYHLRDWLISRQRYWGPPIPMIHCDECARVKKSWFDTGERSLLHTDQSDWNPAGWYPVPHDDLPVELPIIEDYKPKGEGKGPLAAHPEFYEVKCPECGAKANRETDVSDTFLDSSWYFLRYPTIGSKSDDKVPFDPEITKTWLPVDLYFGGAEHAVLHLMYSRFVTKALFDLGLLNFDEPFPKFFAHGLMIKDGAKMSKSRGNVVNPDEYIEKFGADTLRLYLMFMGPMDGYPDFRDSGIEGMRRFVEKVWKLVHEDTPNLDENEVKEIETKMHKTIKRVTEDIENFRYNTAIAGIMEYVNSLRDKVQKGRVDGSSTTEHKNTLKKSEVWNEALKTLTQILAPFAPHMMEEIWCNILNQKFSVHTSDWPSYDESLIVEENIQIIVQVNGKLRSTVTIEKKEATNKEKVLAMAKQDANMRKWLEGKEIKNEIFVPGKLVNFVV